MKDSLSDIFIELEDFSEKSSKEQRKLKTKLESAARVEQSEFEANVRRIVPSENSILFEIYESLSMNPSYWIGFVTSELRRIRKVCENGELDKQESIVSPLVALSFFARNEFEGLNKLINELSNGVKSSSTEFVKVCMDLLMDSYFVDMEEYERCFFSIKKLTNSTNQEIKKHADILVEEKAINPIWQKVKKIALNNTWILWMIILLLLIGFRDGFKTGFLSIGLFGAGSLLGYLLPMSIIVFRRRAKLRSILKELIAFFILITILYFSVENKRILVMIIPFSIPIFAGVLLALRK